MKFCTACGKELNDDAAFCTSCGTAAVTLNTAGAGTAPGTTASASDQSAGTPVVAQPNQSGANTTPTGSSSTPGTTPVQEGPYYQSGASTPQGAPSYQSQLVYPSPGSGKSISKPLIIVISIVAVLCLLGGSILLFSKLAHKDKDGDDTVVVMPSVSDSTAENSAAPSDSVDPSENSVAADSSQDGNMPAFDAATEDNISAAFDAITLDSSKISGFEYYGDWYSGEVYTFTYEGSVFDLLLYEDGTVFSIETGGVQIYLEGYEPYTIGDYLGYTTHFDESYPDNGYVYFSNRNDVDSTLTIETSADYDYVIELIDADTGDLALAYFIQANQIWSMAVPQGEYIIQYAAGTNWINTDELFGTETLFYRSDSTYPVNTGNETSVTLDISGGTGIPSTAITINEF